MLVFSSGRLGQGWRGPAFRASRRKGHNLPLLHASTRDQRIRLPKLDRIDLKILSKLQQSGRITNVELANEVGLSPSPCLMRVRRLEGAGFISGYGAVIDLAKLGEVVTVFTEVTLSDHRHGDFSKFETAVRAMEEVIECHLISGGYDYLLKFITRGIVHYQETIEGLLQLNVGIEKYFSYVVIKSPFVKTRHPLGVLFPTVG